MSSSKIKKNRLLKDLASIIKDPLTDNGIYYVHDESNMLKGYAMIIGPEGTPYHHGFYLFELDYPTDYPFSPPKVTYHTNDGKTRFNPNLYRNGKVCVSILNTWKGEQWTACQSIRSVLMTLLTLFNDNPLVNEPGFSQKSPECLPYKNIVEYMNFRIALCGILNKSWLPEIFYGFYPIIKKYVIDNYSEINKKLVMLQKSPTNKTLQNARVYNMSTTIDYDFVLSQFNEILKLINN
jgi:ubiquitin-conjugating enzyme E2 Z